MKELKPTYPLFLLEEYQGALQYLLVLFNTEQELYSEQIIRKLNLNYRTITNAKGNLISLGLIETELKPIPETKNKSHGLYSWLTEKGKKVALELIEIEKIINKEQD